MNEREANSGMDWAKPDSLLGMLQRGWGKGYLIALKTPPQEVWPLLVECITNDPRSEEQWSPDVEYYVSLIQRTGMDLEPLRSFVKHNNTADEQDWSSHFTLKTLRCLAQRGSRQALEFLREYVRYGYDFPQIAWIVHDLAELGVPEDLVMPLYYRINGDPDSSVVFREEVEEAWRTMRSPPTCEPWKSLCAKHSGFTAIFAQIGLPYDHPPAVQTMAEADLVRLSVEDLLTSVDKTSFFPSRRALVEKVSAEDEDRLLQSLSSDDSHRARLAFHGLGKLGTPKAFEAVKSYIEASEDADSKVRLAAFDAMEQMPGSLTLETARQWFGRKESYLQVAAGRVFEHHAIIEDVPLLIEALRTPETIQGKDSRLFFALRALARFEGLGRVVELERVFCEVGDPYDRGDAAKAMAATSPEHFAAEYAFECLWDSDWRAFKTGCAMVDLSIPGAIERLQELASDPFESDTRGEVAKERLEGIIG